MSIAGTTRKVDLVEFQEYLEAHSATPNTIKTYSYMANKVINAAALSTLGKFHTFLNLQRKSLSQKSFNVLLVSLRSLLRYIEMFELDMDPKVVKAINSIKGFRDPIPIQERRVYSQSEIEIILAADMQPWRWQAIWTLLNFGIRKTELRKLLNSDIDLIRGTLTVRAETSKSKRSRVIPISKRNRSIIQSWFKTKKFQEYYLQLKEGSPISDRSLSYWKPVESKVGLKLKAHNFRYTFATNLYRRTNDIVLVQKMLGHANPSVTSIYLKLTQEDLNDRFLEADLSFH